MEASDQQPAQQAPAQHVPVASDAPSFGAATLGVTSVEDAAPEFLPTMGDLDRLAADLDRVDLTLAQLDDPLQNPNG